jgi:hypothetical protein
MTASLVINPLLYRTTIDAKIQENNSRDTTDNTDRRARSTAFARSAKRIANLLAISCYAGTGLQTTVKSTLLRPVATLLRLTGH